MCQGSAVCMCCMCICWHKKVNFKPKKKSIPNMGIPRNTTVQTQMQDTRTHWDNTVRYVCDTLICKCKPYKQKTYTNYNFVRSDPRALYFEIFGAYISCALDYGWMMVSSHGDCTNWVNFCVCACVCVSVGVGVQTQHKTKQGNETKQIKKTQSQMVVKVRLNPQSVLCLIHIQLHGAVISILLILWSFLLTVMCCFFLS